jgi:hypothetical protein
MEVTMEAELSPVAQDLWAILRTRQGRARAVSAAKLAHWTGLPERQVRAVLKDMIEAHQLPIASTPQRPAGYFLTTSEEEIEAVCRSLRGRALSILRRMACLRRTSLPALMQQLALDFSGEESAPREA